MPVVLIGTIVGVLCGCYEVYVEGEVYEASEMYGGAVSQGVGVARRSPPYPHLHNVIYYYNTFNLNATVTIMIHIASAS